MFTIEYLKLLMSTYDNLTVQVVKKVTNVVFADMSQRQRKFAKKYVKCYDSKEAYEYAFEDIQQVRSSNILKSPEIWEMILTEMMLKKDPTKRELETIEAYVLIQEGFDLSPFQIFKFYIEKHEGVTLASKLNIDCCQAFRTILFCVPFFKMLNRDCFYKPLKEVLLKESEMCDFSGRKDEKEWIIKKAKSKGICFEEIFEK